MKAREIIKILKDDGWYAVEAKGGHRQFNHPDKPGRVTLPFHGMNEDLPVFVAESILKQAGIRKK